MFAHKSIQHIVTFSRKEMTRLYEFAHSPYHNKHKDLRLLVEYLSKLYPNFNKDNCSRAHIFKHLYKDQAYDVQQIFLLFTYLQRLLEKYLIQEQFQAAEGMHKILLLQNLRQRKQYKNYEKILKKQQKYLEQSPFKDGNYYNLKFLTAGESDLYHSQLAQHEVDPSIQVKQDHLDYYYLGEKLKDVCEMKIRGGILKVDYSNQLFEVLIQEMEKNLSLYEQVPSIMVYYHLYQLITKNSTSEYKQALKIVESYESFLPLKELQNIYNHLQNYCIEQINKGDRPFLSASFELYKKQLLKGLLLDDSNFLFEWHYKNIVTIVMRLDEFDWVKDFIETYRDRLHPDVAENAYSYNLASYYYGTDQLEKVQDLLLKVSSKDHRYFMAAKALLMRTYYDLGENEALFSLIRSLGIYLNRSKLIPDQRRKAFLNLLKFTQKATQLKSSIGFEPKIRSRNKLEQLKKRVEGTSILINKLWLEKKLVEIEI